MDWMKSAVCTADMHCFELLSSTKKPFAITTRSFDLDYTFCRYFVDFMLFPAMYILVVDNAKLEFGVVDDRRSSRRADLIVLAGPGWVVDTVDPLRRGQLCTNDMSESGALTSCVSITMQPYFST